MDKLFQKQDNYRALPAVVAQQTLMQVSRDWKAFWKATKAFAKDPSRFKGRPQPPGKADADYTMSEANAAGHYAAARGASEDECPFQREELRRAWHIAFLGGYF